MEAALRQAFRVTLAVTKVDSLLRATIGCTGNLIFHGNGLFVVFVPFNRENLAAHTTELTRKAFSA